MEASAEGKVFVMALNVVNVSLVPKLVVADPISPVRVSAVVTVTTTTSVGTVTT